MSFDKYFLIGVSIVFPLVLIESALRFTGYSPRDLTSNPYFEGETWAAPSKVRGWENRPGQFVSIEPGHAIMNFDAMGRRIARPNRKESDSLRALVIGGSFAQGYGVRDEDTFVFHLNQLISALDTVNLGVGGYGTFQSLLTLESYLDGNSAPPKLIILAMMEDHLTRNVATVEWIRAIRNSGGIYTVPPHALLDGDRLVRHGFKSIRAWPFETSSSLVTLIHEALVELEYGDRRSLMIPSTRTMLETIQSHATEAGADFLLVHLDYRTLGFPSTLDVPGIESLDCRANDRSVPDLWLTRGGHPSPRLHRHWSDCIARWFETWPPLTTQ